MRILDLYCCQGGASRGYTDAGFSVVGVDIDPQPRYPYEFVQMDALVALETLLDGGMVGGYSLLEYDAIHASPPCQLYSLTHRINKSDFPDLIGPTRTLLEKTGLPYIIENVVEAAPRLCNPKMLCGAMFGLETYRHRLFETNFLFPVSEHPAHLWKTTKMGRAVKPGEFMHVVGNFTGVDKGREVMRMPWANRDGLREAIPPAYTRRVGLALMSLLTPISHSSVPCEETK